MSQTSSKWEYAALVAIIVLMAGGSLWTLVAVMRAPDPETGNETPAAASPKKVVRENPRLYHQDMNIFTPRFNASSDSEYDSENRELERLIPDYPGGNRASPAPYDPLMEAQMNRPVRFKSPQEEAMAEDEEKVTTGWGWLADEVAARRQAGETGEGGEPAGDDEAADDEGQQAVAGERTNGERRDETRYFMDEPFGRTEREGLQFRDTMATDEERQARGEPVPGEEDPDDPYAAAEADRPPAWAADAAVEPRDVLAGRDPFAASREADPLFNEPSWGLVGGRASVDVDDRRAFDRAAEDQSARIIRAAEPGGGMFMSDSMFNSGGGYTPEGVNAYRSDTLFSGAGVFGGSPGGSLSPSISSVGGIGSSGTSPLTTPSSSSMTPLGGGRDEGAIATPRALPW